MNKQHGLIADGWLLLIGAIVILGMLGSLSLWLSSVENKGYVRGKAEVQLQFNKFKTDQARLAANADAKARATEAKDKTRQEKADATNKDLRRELDLRRKQLRDARSSAGASVVPDAPAGSGSPDTATFDRAKLDGALRSFTSGVEELIGEGAEAVIDLDTAKAWSKN